MSAFRVACVAGALAVIGLNLRGRQHPGVSGDDSPFIDAWEFSTRTEYGFPLTWLRRFSTVDAQALRMLEWQVDWLTVGLNAVVMTGGAVVAVLVDARRGRRG